MKNTWQIILSGVGGQGLVSCANILGKAASMFEGRNAVMSTSYGVETRGTFTKADVIISTEEIDFPEVLQPDVILALADVAYEKYVGAVEQGTILIYDEKGIKPKPSKTTQYGFPIMETAENMQNVISANILALGIIIGKTGLLKEESIIQAIENIFAGRLQVIERNKDIFNKGVEMASR
jgi:2-oxoglutarate ferredoxin oxidoreductase subunit gamma